MAQRIVANALPDRAAFEGSTPVRGRVRLSRHRDRRTPQTRTNIVRWAGSYDLRHGEPAPAPLFWLFLPSVASLSVNDQAIIESACAGATDENGSLLITDPLKNRDGVIVAAVPALRKLVRLHCEAGGDVR